MTALQTLVENYSERASAAREWKAAGGLAVGYVGVDVPAELLIGAGVFPLRLTADPAGSTALADRYVAPTFNPMVRSLLNRLLDGTYAFLDHIILTNSSEALVRLFYCLREIKRVEPYAGTPDFYFFEFLHTRFRSSALYNRDRTRGLWRQLETWTGKAITDAALRAAIAVCNENRRLLQALAYQRIAPQLQLSGVTASQIIGASMFMPKAEHNRLLREALREISQYPPRHAVRLFVEGSSLDHTQLYEILESTGAVVVAEDSDWGNRAFDTLVDETCASATTNEIGPLDAIVERYHYTAPSPTKSTIQERVDYCVRRAVEAKADGVVFFLMQGENPPAWDYPEQRKALEARGIRTLCLDRQPYALADIAGLKAKIEAFVQTFASPSWVAR